MSGAEMYIYGYYPIGDILVLANVIIFTILLQLVYVRPRKEIKAFKGVLICTAFAAVFNLLRYEFYINAPYAHRLILYALRCGYILLLFLSLYFYIKYIELLLQLTDKKEKKISQIALGCVCLCFVLDIISSVMHVGFYYLEDMTIHLGNNMIFAIEYIFLVGLIFYMIQKYGERIFRPLVGAFFATNFVSLIVMVIQGVYNQRSFTTATFIFPAFAVLYILHSNPYDPELGALHIDALDEIIQDSKKKNKQLIILSYYLHEYDVPGKAYSQEIRDGIRKYVVETLKKASLVKISNGRMMLLADTSINPDYEKKIEFLLAKFDSYYEKYQEDYKIVIMPSHDSFDSSEEYINFVEFIQDSMRQNEVYRVKDEDYEKYNKHRYIVEQLEDINKKKDLLDPRVTVFCQPVYNVITGKYDSAEALMRLTLKDTGMVFPDQFIPIAEKHNYIHSLSMIILSKTCHEIKEFIDNGYEFNRISVNFSILDFREKDFCDSVIKIINDAGIPFDKVAMEVTESQNEKDFKTIRDIFSALKNTGITLYLDDFGTGYSSFERIVEIPFDIIKFDRSLVIASGEQVKAETTVSYLAHMFTDLNYSVLFEGIEDENDENRCVNMYARYLQGYKYSKPIPIGRLAEFFEKKEEAVGTT